MSVLLKNLSPYILLLFFAFCNNAHSQDMWPGDVNNNGTVNGVDMLYLGQIYNAMGPIRPGATEDWASQAIDPWTESFPNGINYAFADTNGDGTVNEDDIYGAIQLNYGEIHGVVMPDNYSPGTDGNSPVIRLEAISNFISPGVGLVVDLYIGEETQTVEDFYGISMLMSFTPNIVQIDDVFDFNYDNQSWIDATGNDDVRALFVQDGATGKAELTLTRIDQGQVSGSGKVGSFSIIIEDIVVGLVETLDLSIDEVLLLNQDLEPAGGIGDELSVVVTTSTEDLVSQSTVLYPNPGATNAEFTVSDLPENFEIIEFYITNSLGQEINITDYYFTSFDRKELSFRLSNSQQGLYTLNIRSPKQIISKMLLINQ